MQTYLGYFINLNKSHLQPSSRMIHLGLGICSKSMSFWIPDKKKVSFAEVREKIVADNAVMLKPLQRFVGKCQSFVLVFPSASLFVRECCSFMSELDDVTPVDLTQSVREEILFWRFVDSVTEPIPWRLERHLVLKLSSDASSYRWGGVLVRPTGDISFGDYWSAEVREITDICYKEALALYFVLLSVIDLLWDRRVDVQVDSMALFLAWGSLRAKSRELARVLRLIFALTLEANFALKLEWVPSSNNPADSPSRELSLADARLAPSLWVFLQKELGGSSGFTWDLMALPSNVPRGKDGTSLKFFSRYLVPGTSGINVFAQQCPRGERLYVFPPFVLIPSLIRLFREWGDVMVTLVVPKHAHPRTWWPEVGQFVRQSLRLAERGQVGVLEYPSRQGYVRNSSGIPFELWAFQCFFPLDTQRHREIKPPDQEMVLIVSDSMYRGLLSFGWPASLDVRLSVNGGARMEKLCRIMASFCRARTPRIVVLHGGINDFSRLSNGSTGVEELLRVFSAVSTQFHSQFPTCDFVMSAVCPTQNCAVNRFVAAANGKLREQCRQAGWHFLSNDYLTQSDLADEVHLTTWGTLKLHHKLRRTLMSIQGHRSGVQIPVEV